MWKIFQTNPIFKMVKMNNHLKFFRPFRICYYLQLKLLNNNITQEFLKNWQILSTIPKAYWSLLKTFLNNKEIPCIPPLFHNIKFIPNFRDKAELFNNFLLSSVLWSKMQVKLLHTQYKNNQNTQSQLLEPILPK